MTIEYSPISYKLRLEASIHDLSPRDMVELCRTLMHELGITSRLSEEADATERAQEIITEQWTRFWEAKP